MAPHRDTRRLQRSQYLVGAAHPHKLDPQRLLESAFSACERLVTDAEVLQEICHRYAAINQREAIQPAFDAILGVVDDVRRSGVLMPSKLKTRSCAIRGCLPWMRYTFPAWLATTLPS
jgi:hypothetical protein